MPSIEYKEPVAFKDYDLYEIDGIKVYIHKKVHTNKGITFTLSKFLFFKTVEARGITIL